MSIFKGIVTGVLLCVSCAALAQSPDQRAAERVLGPHWKQVSRAAGLIFTGTVLSIERYAPTQDSPVPTFRVKFHVDRGVAGVRSGQVITIREWAAVWPMQRPMRRAQRMLLFFYPPSSAGLSSPVGGPMGQIAIDAKGNFGAGLPEAPVNDRAHVLRSPHTVVTQPDRLSQIERAIRSAREGKE